MKRLLPLALALALLAGCTPPAAQSPAPVETPVTPSTQAPAPSGPPVYTDYSQLTPYEKTERPVAKFTRRYEEFTDTLIPTDDYGPLIPFAGVSATRSEDDGWGWMEDYDLYGLMTLDGEVIVDPVFSSAYAPSVWDPNYDNRRTLGCLVLQKVIADEKGEPVSVAALCARDGSWCTGFDYIYDWELMMDSFDEAVPLYRWNGPNGAYNAVVFLDPDTGEEVKTVDLSKVLKRWPNLIWTLPYQIRCNETYPIFSDDDAHYLFDSDTGEVRSLEELLNTALEGPYTWHSSENLCRVKTASGWGYIDGGGNWVTDPIYEEAGDFENGRALVRDMEDGGSYKYIDRRGKVIYTFPASADTVSYFGEFLSYKSGGRRSFLDKDLRPLSLPDDFTDPYKQGDWFIQELPDPSPTVPGGWAFWNYKTGARRDFPGEWEFSHTSSEDKAIFNGYAGKSRYALADLNTGEIIELGQWSSVYFTQDELTGETYLFLARWDEAGETPASEWRRLNGDILYRIEGAHSGYTSLWGGRVLTSGDNAVTLTELRTGELLFSWPLYSLED